MMLGALVAWSKGPLPIWAVDAFCGPCFHHAMNHLVQVRTAPSCPECPGMDGQPATWDRVGGDPSLEGFDPKACRHCPVTIEADPCSHEGCHHEGTTPFSDEADRSVSK